MTYIVSDEALNSTHSLTAGHLSAVYAILLTLTWRVDSRCFITNHVSDTVVYRTLQFLQVQCNNNITVGERAFSVAAAQANSAFHPSGVGK